ncbi:MAG: signal recognition particle-docking protein FtsY [Flavobacteriaceae bacterium]|nr:signal recognition particle-docking protein FtsY [Flavobacteriaceae bacterium]
MTNFWCGVRNLFSGKKILDSQVLDNFEELLIEADVGIDTTELLIEKLSNKFPKIHNTDPKELSEYLKKEITELIEANQLPGSTEIENTASKPYVTLVVGVNGSGKTTTIGKLAYRYKSLGKKVLLGAGDTFRSGAIEQLSIWSERVNCRIVKQQIGSDPAAVAYDTVQSALSKGDDFVLIDTAGRMANHNHLMQELKKIKRTIGKVIPAAPNEVLLVMDGSTGQNAIVQAGDFIKHIGITSLAITKLDGTSKGGMLLGISQKYGIPIKYIGVGERIDELLFFDTNKYVNSLFAS